MIICILKIFLYAVLGFVLLTYTIYLYEKTNQDGTRIVNMLNPANLWLTFRVLVKEYISLLVTLVLWPFGYINFNEATVNADRQLPVLFLHGLFLNRSCWFVTKLRLRLMGFTNLHSINLTPLSDIETLTEKVALKVDSLRHACNCEKVHLVGHSMGGVIARNFIQIRGGANKVEQCVIFGTPNKGSKLAPFAVTRLAEAVIPKCEFLENLNKKAFPKKVAVSNIYSRHDNLVIPYDSSMTGKVKDIELLGVGHNTLLYDNTVFNHIVNAIKATEHADNSSQQSQEG